MKSRWHLQNKSSIVEFAHGADGLKQAVEFRKSNPAFKGKRIKSVIQVYPDQIPLGKVVQK